MRDPSPMASVHSAQDLEHPLLHIPDPNPSIPPLPLFDHRREVSLEELQHEDGVLAILPEMLDEVDDVGGATKSLEGLDLAQGALIIVHLLKSDSETIGEAAGTVDVRISAGADTFKDLVAGGYLYAAVDAPAPAAAGGGAALHPWPLGLLLR